MLQVPVELMVTFIAGVILTVIGYIVQAALKKQPTMADVWVRLGVVEKHAEDLELRLTESERRENEVKLIVRRWMNKLRAWDQAGRSGELPMPSDEEMMKLEP